MRHVTDLIIGIGWLVFWIYWFAMAAKAGRPTQPRSPIGIAMRLLILAVVIVTLRLSRASWGHMHQSLGLQALGLALFALGLLLAIWARVNLSTNWSFPADERHDTELIVTGPYRFIRHPIYSGILLAMAGTAIGVTFYWLIVGIVFGLYFISSAVREEKYLATVFPKAYPAYVRKSKMLIPFIF